jgi:predicted nucleotidyltransferase
MQEEAIMRLPPDVAVIVELLRSGAREALGANLLALYLRGSLVTGDFDPEASDVDFFVVTVRRLMQSEFARLAAMHEGFARLGKRFGDQLEGPNMDRAAARHFRPGECHPTIVRNEALLWREHYLDTPHG